MEKSHVSIEVKVCPICVKQHDVGVLLDKRLKKSLERRTVTGMAICPECEDKYKKGYVALVEIDPEKSEIKEDGTVSISGAYRTSRIVHVKNKVFTPQFPAETPFTFVSIDFMNNFLANIEQNENESN